MVESQIFISFLALRLNLIKLQLNKSTSGLTQHEMWHRGQNKIKDFVLLMWIISNSSLVVLSHQNPVILFRHKQIYRRDERTDKINSYFYIRLKWFKSLHKHFWCWMLDFTRCIWRQRKLSFTVPAWAGIWQENSGEFILFMLWNNFFFF